ncbi:hypothetical protein [Amycolatopsis sp. NPDC004378]
MNGSQGQELVILLTGSAEVLASSADDYAACARSLARLDERFGPRLRRLADEAFEIAKVLQAISHQVGAAVRRKEKGGGR